MSGNIRFSLKLAILLIVAGFLSSCGDDEATDKGAAWLQENLQVPVNSGWKIQEVSVIGKGKLDILVDMYSATAANKLNSLSAMDKGEVARLVCPIRGTEFWEIVGNKATVTVKLASMGKTQATAICRR
ncbi:MAG: hypothetical protein HOE62_16110 [Alphaproteobacteria bacterium]|jgi:hypothetical protein|nr:hypothetical protein [Alphaproteobacteria bacterium]MBT4019478.1 hypothetical protein [Alphaproteobacteria bacterium]MBT4967300.1 hypothetical protein [Alphaproteobacteria bacterium]MBT5159754.1 hypothetical protein [Alphaproteobacteria bacterium]MBT5919266.1 hypothetical protein [Alphaproteobacteria bacterium]